MQRFKENDKVTFVPNHAKGNINHPDCRIGFIKNASDVKGEMNQRVRVSFEGKTAIPIPARNLILHPRNQVKGLPKQEIRIENFRY